AAKGSADGYDAYLASIKQVLVEKAKETVKKFKVEGQDAPGFTLKDLDGNAVSLASLKGKVVVLDFWATWCGPCKKSFPAMQMAVDKYRNNKDVVFLFIDTWEHTDNPAPAVKQYITGEKYTFQVLLDPKDEVTKSNSVVDSYKVTGIPTKFVIGANGQIMYRLTGFSGGNDTAVEELSAMIETASM
ncbi:MAG: TlpA family protein disulfide reductase, partial [Bacteroidetes bacterium]|nr:TlpA family protein disulfide reductase [Bacteroidota bacterium]